MSTFNPIINQGELLINNPEGDVAVCTLWTPRERWRSLLEKHPAACNEGRVAVIGNLYDPKGVPNIIRNLCANPHIRVLYVVGSDLSRNLTKAIEQPFERDVPILVKGEDEPMMRNLRWVELYELSDRKDNDTIGHSVPAQEPPHIEREELLPPDFECVSLETPVPGALFYGKNLLEVWNQLCFYIQQFGTQYKSGYGNTLEILGMTTVVQDAAYQEGLPFTKEEGEEYVNFLLDFNEKPEVSYDYGPLIGGIMEIEKQQFSSRHAYWPVYAPSHRNTKEPPCLVSCWFKEREGVLHSCYVFRSQDMYAGYSRNVYGLHRFQKILAAKHGLKCGPMITQTHSAHIYERDIDLELESPVIMDPACDCIISVEEGEIQVDITRGGNTIQRLSGTSHRRLEKDLRHYVGDVSHAMYLGRELYKAELRLKGLSG